MYRLPAEWERQSGVQLTLPHGDTDWMPYLDEALLCFASIAREIAKRELLLIVAPDVEYAQRFLREHGVEMSRVRFCECATNDTWARDHAGITLTASKEPTENAPCGEHRILDFRFNGWGGKYEAELDNAITRAVYGNGLLRGSYEDNRDFVLEGGSIESDGQGTILTTTSCLLSNGRNGMTREQVETELKHRLHAERVLWLTHGSIEGDDTDGHIDTLARLAPDDTILYVDGQPDMEAELKAFRTMQGKPYRLLALPKYDGENSSLKGLPATYANFLIINDAVLYPTYGSPKTDAEAGRVISIAFPDREVVPIDCRVLVRQYGSLHCVTMQFPADVLA